MIELKMAVVPGKESTCPVCGSETRYGSFELVDCGGVYEWECPSCGATGKEGYDLVFDGFHYDVRNADGTAFKRGRKKNG